MKKEKEKYLAAAGLGVCFLSIASLFLVAHFTKTVIVLLILNLIQIYLVYRSTNKLSKRINVAIYVVIGISFVLGILYLITKNYYVLILFQMINFFIGFVELIVYLYFKRIVWKNNNLSNKIKYSMVSIITIGLLLMGTFLIKTAIKPNGYINSLKNIVGMIELQETITVNYDSKYYKTNDIKYSDKYPNSYFDIYNNTENFSELKPVFIYLHGGGWVYGDKASGDPTSTDMSGYYDLLKKMVDEGYSVLSVNYALAPENTYPTPIYQMVELMKFLKEYGAEYGLDANFLVLGGGSAGAHIVGQFAATQTNLQYAKKLGIQQVLTNKEIKGLYLGCGLLNPSKVTDSKFFVLDHMLYQLIRGYFNTGSLEDNKDAIEANIINYVTSDYPETYITDGNLSTYNKQAHDLDKRLTELGVKHTSFILDSNQYKEDFIFHSYDITDSNVAKENLENLAIFVRNIKSNN